MADYEDRERLERAVIGSLLRSGTTDHVRDIISIDDFRLQRCHDAYAACNGKVDLIALSEKMQGRMTNPHAWLADCMELADSLDPTLYARLLRERNIRDSIALAAKDPLVPLQDVIEGYQQSITPTTGVSADNAVAQLMAATDDRSFVGPKTGILPIDELIGNLPRALVVVAGYTSVGKSAFCCQVARNVAGGEWGVVIVSLELTAAEVIARMAATRARVPYRALLRDELGVDGWNRVANELAAIAELPLRIVHASLTARALAAVVRREARLLGREHVLVVVDHLQRLKRQRRQSEYEALSEATALLAELAIHDLGGVVLVASQLHRPAGVTKDYRPGLRDLRGSGTIEQDAQLVMIIQDPGEGGLAIVDVAKHTQGPRGEVELAWSPAEGRFT